MIEINAAGITNRDIPVEQQAKGEVGIGHWRKALNGYCVDTPKDAERICAQVLAEMSIHTPLREVFFRAKRASLRGLYGAGRIQLFGYPRLATLLHELAHHVTRDTHPRARAHGKEFKQNYRSTFLAFARVHGLNLAAAAEEARAATQDEVSAIEIGSVVKARDGRTFEVTGFGRTRLRMTCQKTGREGFTANPIHMELTETPKAAPKQVTVKEIIKVAMQKTEEKAEASADAKVVNRIVDGTVWTVLSEKDGKVRCEAHSDHPKNSKWKAGRVRTFKVDAVEAC